MNIPILLLLLAEADATPTASYVTLGVAAISIVVTFITSYFAYKGNKDLIKGEVEINRLTALVSQTQISLDMAKQEINLDSYALSFPEFMESWNEIAAKLNTLFKTTKTNRFLILRAWNGYEAPRYTTAVIQYRQGEVEHSDYVHFELDTDYVQKLLNTRHRKMWKVDTSKEGDTAIGKLYRSETPSVKFANWFFINDKKIDDKRVVITYCSFGTAEDEDFTEREEIKQRLLVSLIQERFDGKSLHTTR